MKYNPVSVPPNECDSLLFFVTFVDELRFY